MSTLCPVRPPVRPAAAPGRRLRGHRLPGHGLLGHRRGLREALLLGLLWLLYEGGRLLSDDDLGRATSHAQELLRVERLLHLDVEQGVVDHVLHQPLLAVPASWAYAGLHYVITPLVLLWLFRARPDAYPAARRALVAATGTALLGYVLLPMAPPRLLPGGVDLMAHYSGYGWWGDAASAPAGLGGLTNQLAAMPSLHVGWALWCGWVLWTYATRRALRVAGVVYPLLVSVVVVATANHYLLDVAAGAALVAVWLAVVHRAPHGAALPAPA